MINKLEISRELADLTIAALQEEGRWDVADRIEASLSAPVVKPVPPLIQTLHANGDRIAMEATIAQQAQRIADLEATPVVERQPLACEHEWTDDGEFLLMCTVCGAQEDHNPAWRDMASAPRDGTMLRLLVAFEEHATEDADEAPTIGANNFDNDEIDEWKFAGWCWTHDHFTQGIGTPIGWLPMIEAEQPAPVAISMSFAFQHPMSKERRTVSLTKQDVYDGMEDYFYDKLGEQICQCESVGETNVVDCDCDEYVHDFELVADDPKVEQPAPVAVVLPDRAAFEAWRDRRNASIAEHGGSASWYVSQAHYATWEACLDKVKELNQ